MMGSVWSFGSGFAGQLGHGDLESSGTPRIIKRLRGKGIAQVYAGFDSDVSFAVARNGDVYVWGKRNGPTGLPLACSLNVLLRRTYRGNGGDLDSSDDEDDGEGDVAGRIRTATIRDTKGAASVNDVLKDGDEEASNEDEEEEDEEEEGGDEDFVHPVKLFSLCGEGISCIAVGRTHCCAKTKDGDVFSWGHNDHCQLGYEPIHHLSQPKSKKARVRYGVDAQEPVLWERTISETCVVDSVAVGTNHTFVVTDKHQVLAFGQMFATDEHSSLARSLAKLQVAQISCGAMHAGLVTMNGQVYTWGSGDGGYVTGAPKTLCSQDSSVLNYG
jgi:alpha-tubulin suppressor-like RCC1 family protein